MPSLDCELIQSVIEHMNEDHASAVLVYVRAFSGKFDAESARLMEIDVVGMRISYQVAGISAEVRVPFGRSPGNAGEIRAELVRMAKEGREILENRS